MHYNVQWTLKNPRVCSCFFHYLPLIHSFIAMLSLFVSAILQHLFVFHFQFWCFHNALIDIVCLMFIFHHVLYVKWSELPTPTQHYNQLKCILHRMKSKCVEINGENYQKLENKFKFIIQNILVEEISFNSL